VGELANGDAREYGGSGGGGGAHAEAVPHHGLPFSLSLTLPAAVDRFLRGGPA